MFDVIGDIHGQAQELENLLDALGYQKCGAGYTHDDRKVIFLGDFIDRGPYQKRVLSLARTMVEEGAALAVMGNHEYNAIAYFTSNENGGHLRERSTKNLRQHQAFLDEYSDSLEDWQGAVNWFKTLPLWLDLDGLRVIHACWDPIYIEKISESYSFDGTLTEELLQQSSIKGTWQHKAIETLLKGKEIELPNGAFFHDKDGNRRHEIRVKWWSPGNSYRDAYMGPESAITHIPDDPINSDHFVEYGRHEKPVFLGHYWLEGVPSPLAENIACIDYSVAKPGGKLVAYRWDGEQKIDPIKYVFCERLG